MNVIVFHLISGDAFFSGFSLIATGAVASRTRWKFTQRLTWPAMVIGLVLVVLSSVPVPYWFAVPVAIASVMWGCPRVRNRFPRGSVGCVIAVCVLAVLCELRWHQLPVMASNNVWQLTVIGDSLTAGLGEPGDPETWPRRLVQQHELAVQDISHVGDTVAAAAKRVASHGIQSPIVLLEIGGNDILGSTTPDQFEQDLHVLLRNVSADGRKVLMFELPLPPLYHRYGSIQRRLSRQYNVGLIPRRVLASAIAGSGATLDSIHLTGRGHQHLADPVWQIVCPN